MTVVFVAFVMNVAFARCSLHTIVMHGNLVLANMTTIEMYEKKKTLPWKYDKGRWRILCDFRRQRVSLSVSRFTQ